MFVENVCNKVSFCIISMNAVYTAAGCADCFTSMGKSFRLHMWEKDCKLIYFGKMLSEMMAFFLLRGGVLLECTIII